MDKSEIDEGQSARETEKEKVFAGKFEAIVREVLGGKAVVSQKYDLLYELYLNRRLNLAQDIERPAQRGNSAFETDLCIFDRLDDGKDFPRIVMEIKSKLTSHDILSYSAKAGKHKQVFPWLRYGFVIYAKPTIPRMFFVHNEHLDFCIATGQCSGKTQLKKVAKGLIEKELQISKTLEEIQFDRRKIDYYCRDILCR